MKKFLLVVLCAVMVFGTSTVFASDGVDGNLINKEVVVKKTDKEVEELNLQRLKNNAEHHVSRFEENPTDETLKNTAQKAIKALPENEKEPYQERYDVAIEKVALAEAQEAVEVVEAVNPIAANSIAINEAKGLLDKATEAVEALEDSEEKTALEKRIKAQQALIDAANLKRLKDNAEYHVSKFEASPTDETLATNAQAAINALPKAERAVFQERYDEVATKAIEEITRKTFYTFQIGNEFYTYKNADGNVTRYLMDVKPYILNDRTMLPMRYTAYTLGLQVAYDDTTRTAVFFDEDTVVTIDIDSNEVKLNDSVVKLDAPIQNIDGRLMTPVSQIAKLFGRTNGDWNDGIAQDIEWVNQHRLVYIFN